jgi:hypothetical protein
MSRRTAALLCIVLTVGCTAAAIVIGGSRPASDPGAEPAVIQGAGYLFGLLATGLLLWPHTTQESPAGEFDRVAGGLLAGAVIVLAVLDYSGLTDAEDGANIGAGLLRLLGLVTVLVAAALVAAGSRRTPRTRS